MRSFRTAVVIGMVVVMGASAIAADCFRTSIGLVPSPVTRTPTQVAASVAAASQIVPRNTAGVPDLGGDVVFIGIGMSNTSNVWNGFRAALNQAGTAPESLYWLDATKGGQGSPQWADPLCACWTDLDAKLAKKNKTHAQVGAVFVMLTTPFPTLDPVPNAAQYLSDYLTVLALIEARFPHVKLIYLAGNYYGGYDTNQDKTPEPHDYYENAILQQIQDQHIGSAIPVGLTIWADGIVLRPWDGLTLLCTEVTSGGVHLNATGRAKYGQWLYDWLTAEPSTAGWMR